ncbi:integrase catalytic domain-containing protein [Trichonephila clavipes]|nr:integrase catalytic domain-containing protein [Trichonephila clavipes]
MGISDTEKNMLDSDNEYISSFENNLKFNNGMYETKLFWEDKPRDLENNWAIAKRRFGNLNIKMQDNNWLYNQYKNIVKDQIKENIVEECTSHFETNSYYMPHSAVVRKDKETTKVRMVFGASSKGAFLTIGIAEEDRDYLRFFWFPNDGDVKSYKIMRMNRVPFGVTLSPFILAATIKFHIRKYKEDYRETYELLNTSLYVDDLFADSSESVYKAFDLSKDAIEILKDANMNLRKFKTNSKELRKLWNENGIGDVCESGKASNYKQFVSNRVIEIQSNSDPSDWHHCSGRENPADYVSRGANLESIINSQFRMHGPQWLCTTENNWPKSFNCDFSSTDPCESEEQVFTFACELNTASIINLSKFSSLQKLLRVTSWVLRFVHNIRNRFNKRSDDLSTEEIDDELIRVGGRLQKSKFSYLQKHPIILPAKHYFVNLMVRDSHEKVFHGGVSETLLEIRERFWLIKGRQTVKNILKKCLICKRFSSTSGVQVTAPLPALRVEQSAPFSVVGIDFGGPLYTKDENKHYIVLFTCAVTRALHLELVNKLTTETFLLALRRFISRRGLCPKILTDNAKTFKKSELELKNLWKIISDPTVKAFYASHKIYWQFIMEPAPWWSGFYERLIRTVKLALRKTVGRATLFRDELETLLIEIEGVLNSRPLTYIFSEFNEAEPLTPSHMILGRRVNSLPPARLNFDSKLSNRKVLIKRFNYRERLLNMFWTKWSKEYICMLKSAHCVKPTGEIKEFKIDDVVLINDEKFPRHFWKLGKVVDVFPGRDGKIRSFQVPKNRLPSTKMRLDLREPFEAPPVIDCRVETAILSPRIKAEFGTVEIAKEQLHSGLRASELTRTRCGITQNCWTPVTYPMYRTLL